MSIDYPGIDPEVVQRAFADDANLNIRHQTHALYTVPHIDYAEWVVNRLTWRGDERVLDLGAGAGAFFAAVKARVPFGQHYAGDLSLGMIRRQQAQAAAAASYLTNLNAQALPFADDTFDVVLANHILHLVPDLEAAALEIRRVLKPEGVLLAATFSLHNMPELTTLYRRALLLLTDFEYEPEVVRAGMRNFALENGSALLSQYFYAVARYDLPAALIFEEPEPVIAYLESTRDLEESRLPDGITWDAFVGVMAEQVRRVIAHTGRLVIRKLTGAMVATDQGGFAAEYCRLLRSTRPT